MAVACGLPVFEAACFGIACMRWDRSLRSFNASSRWRTVMARARRSCSRRLPSNVVFSQLMGGALSFTGGTLLQPFEMLNVVQIACSAGDAFHGDKRRN